MCKHTVVELRFNYEL